MSQRPDASLSFMWQFAWVRDPRATSPGSRGALPAAFGIMDTELTAGTWIRLWVETERWPNQRDKQDQVLQTEGRR